MCFTLDKYGKVWVAFCIRTQTAVTCCATPQLSIYFYQEYVWRCVELGKFSAFPEFATAILVFISERNFMPEVKIS